jgi:hypothetical protein
VSDSPKKAEKPQMNQPDKPSLKIADTPTEEDAAMPATKPCQPSKSKRKDHRKRGLVQRLTPEEMDAEIDRVSLGNGRPILARGTDRQPPGDGGRQP